MKIVIVGGGTAGWLTALFMLKVHPEANSVTLIESSKIGIIGAGEGSTGLLLDLVTNAWFDTGTNVQKFMEATDSTPKLGIRHINWTGDGSSYYAPLDGSYTSQSNPDVEFLNIFSSYGKEKMHLASEIGRHFEHKQLPGFGGALHFDAHKIGHHFRDVLSNENIDVIDDIVVDAALTTAGAIESVTLQSGKIVTGDFFFDSSGFSRVLASKMGVGWKDYTDHLTVNKAMPFILPREEGQDIEPVTRAHALSAGWMWQIPLKSRIGCGYVYDGNYITDEQAKLELEKVVGQEIEPIRVLSFTSGRSEVLWKNNCIFIGLSSAFAEPLEATSIHTTIVQLLVFSFEFMTDSLDTTVTDINIERYNARMTKMYDDIRDFLVMHYQGGRTDSEFWRVISSGATLTDFSREVLERSKTKIPGVFQFDYYYGSVGAPLWNWVLAGLGKITPEQAKRELELYGK
jgi:hypothetical protein